LSIWLLYEITKPSFSKGGEYIYSNLIQVKKEKTVDDKNKNLIAYCGLYCGDCFSYKGKIADLAIDLRQELRQAQFDKTAEFMSNVSFFKVFKNYSQCYEVLGSLVRLRCKNACKGGGGPPSCKIRRCCHKGGIKGCWECDEFETRENLDFLKANHGDAHMRNLRIIKKKGIDEFLEGKRHWYSEVKNN
jgi:hypothetical protein